MKIVRVWNSEHENLWFEKMDGFLKSSPAIMKYGEEVYNVAINKIYLELSKVLWQEADENSDLDEYISENIEKIIDFNSNFPIGYIQSMLNSYKEDYGKDSINLKELKELLIEDKSDEDIVELIISKKVDEIRSEIFEYLSSKIGDYNHIFNFLTHPYIEIDRDYYKMFQNAPHMAYVDVMEWIRSGFQY